MMSKIKKTPLQYAVVWAFRFVPELINIHDNFGRNQCMCSAMKVCHLLWLKAKDFLITQHLYVTAIPLG